MITIEFGSQTRGDCDSFSDRDLLMIGTNSQLIPASTDERWANYSVSRFTYDKAAYLITSGSLFFKHILDEGKLVEGSAADANRLFGAWKAASSYREEIDENIDLLDLMEFIPKSMLGRSVAIDIIFTALRSVLIRELASDGLFLFSWKQILQKAELLGWISTREKFLFFQARKLKNAYRRGEKPHIQSDFFNRFSEAAFKTVRVGRRTVLADRRALFGLPDHFLDRSYKQLRAIELLCAEYEFDNSISHFREWVKNPTWFCSGGYS